MFISSFHESLLIEKGRHEQELAAKGFTIYDNAINNEVLNSIRNEILFLHEVSVLESSPSLLNDKVVIKKGVLEKAIVERGGSVYPYIEINCDSNFSP